MRAVVQRVSEATVTYVASSSQQNLLDKREQLCGGISNGVLVYIGIGVEDAEEDAEYLADKIAHLRIFMDDCEKMNLSILDLNYEALVISQFTLLADARKGRRPSYSQAAESSRAKALYEFFCERLREQGLHVQMGKFQEIMRVRYINEGPVTILLDSKKAF
ncbi:D-tyrosyl-tRNA(Tyr) deacylase [uncultured spirochete]|jgi:D-tyrosyl-tRNA(Tyr) deacylase|uniref:D-aminoacyl-tRNA deacylase n=1 Tax=uncultured spirochete TaxID=156406 RepID=A0A3P3XTK9_9SPIR|nr:D-tyrosyl-tRNA(Tyr) deacylase [uncultured spirochete]